MLKWSIRSRLLISFLLLGIVSISMLGGYILWYFYRHNLESLTSHLLTQAQITEQLLLHYMHDPESRAAIDPQIKDLSKKNELRLTVMDANGTILADSWEDPQVMENHLQRPEIAAAMETGQGTAIRYSTTLGQNLLYAAIPIRQDGQLLGVVRTASTLSYVEAGFSQIRSAVLAAILLISLLTVIISLRLARHYTAPLEMITDAALDIAHGNLKRRIHIRTGDELEFLSQTLNNLAANLDDKINEAQEETHKLSLILQHMDNAVILLDRYGRVTAANKMARDLFTITNTMMGQHNLHVIGNGLLSQAIQETILNMENKSIDLKTSVGGNKRVFQVFVAPIMSAENDITGVLTVFHDITALQEIHERQAEFVANASHELATPLTAIKGFAETLLDGALQDPALGTKFVTIIHNQAERMHRLVKDLLQLAKLNSQEYLQHITMSPTSLRPLIEAVIQELSPHAAHKQQTIQLEGEEELLVSAHPDWLKQALVNLLDNSIKYTPKSGKISVCYWKEADRAFIRVKDSGLGIPAQDLPLIFDRFYRVERARTRNSGGTGLGLAIVKFIVEMHGGRISVESAVNSGTAFTFFLPVSIATSDREID
ncbi:hypothetical protein P22_2563 [Propionispora sp. 2/2-37]|uniref:sensor histidine kinase n=1 Tax=Propionispora sp. 2/2-37 TaxID=1677858 RepID=UPI0006BB990B|nr:ATP-binding protein [Propionispora sp. 2/2-37]CUH96473.1 hypothetical protein P22_2563 [Propionispora sp. 2/2-37]